MKFKACNLEDFKEALMHEDVHFLSEMSEGYSDGTDQKYEVCFGEDSIINGRE